MGINKCKHCGHEFYNTINICPNCGTIISHNQDNDEITKTTIEPVKENSEVIPEFKDQNIETPYEASLQENSKYNTTFKKRKNLAILLLVCLAIMIGGGFAFKSYKETQNKKAYNEYIDNLTKTRDLMGYGGVEAEELCNLTIKVWNNAIFKVYSDETDKFTHPGYDFKNFNDAIELFNNDAATIKSKITINNYTKQVQEKMIELENPPKGLEKCHDAFVEFYVSYESAVSFSQSPSGSLSSYRDSKKSKFEKVANDYTKLTVLIPEKKQ